MSERVVLGHGEHDISDDLYFLDPCPTPSLSASMAKDFIMGTPLHAWTNSQRLNPYYKSNNATAFDIGSAFHTMMLSRGARIEVIDAKDYRTKDAKEAREAAYERGATPLLADQFERVEAMERAARAQLAAHRCGDPFHKGNDTERALIWEAEGVWNRCKVDLIDRENRVLYDLKTCAGYADASGWARTNMGYGIDMRVALYLEGAREVLGGDWRYFIVVVEKDAPHGLCVVEMPPGVLEMGAAKIARARQMLSKCLKHDRWPCYPAEVIQPSVPPWFAADWIERQSFEDDYKKRTGKDVLDAAFNWQAPEGYAAK